MTGHVLRAPLLPEGRLQLSLTVQYEPTTSMHMIDTVVHTTY